MAELVASQGGFSTEEPLLNTSLVSVGVDAGDAYARGLVDINFFAGLALPHVCSSALPYFYIACWQLIVNRSPENIGKILRFALGLPRGHAKTTFVKILLAWLIAYGRANFVLIVCATEGNASNILQDLDSILGSSNMEAVYGAWTRNLITDNTESKKCSYNGRIVTLEAKGAGSALRGLNKENVRPDIILCDDAQTRENDESPTDSVKLKRWFVATLLKVIDVTGNRLIIYIGNMYSEKCILRQLQKSPNWISLVTGAILEDGEPLWADLHSLESLMESYLHDESLGEADVWFAEVMNDPRNAATSLLSNPFTCYEGEEYVADGVFITIDPAGYRKNSDDNVIVVHETVDQQGVVAKIVAGNYNPEEIIQHALALAFEYGASVIGIETVAYQQTLKFWMEKYLLAMKITSIQVVELKPHGRTKESRIRNFVKNAYAGNYTFKTPEERALFTYQGMAYKIGAKDNKDDILDAVSYGEDIRQEYWHLLSNNKRLLQKYPDAKVQTNNTPF